MTDERSPAFVWCGECKHEWAFAYLPLDSRKFLRALRSLCCPMCAAPPKKIFMGRATETEPTMLSISEKPK